MCPALHATKSYTSSDTASKFPVTTHSQSVFQRAQNQTSAAVKDKSNSPKENAYTDQCLLEDNWFTEDLLFFRHHYKFEAAKNPTLSEMEHRFKTIPPYEIPVIIPPVSMLYLVLK